MADKQFIDLDLIQPKDNMAVHVIDKDNGRDRHIDQEDYNNFFLSKIPDAEDFHDYPTYTASTIPSNSIVAVERGDQSGYNGITLAELDKYFFDKHHPVGCVYENYSDSRNPSVIHGVGTWVALAPGKVLLGVGTGSDINAVNLAVSQGESGGEYTVTLEDDEIPKHTHSAYITPNPHNHQVFGASGGSGGVTTNDGASSSVTTSSTSLNVTVNQQTVGDQPHNNIQPWVAVYRWRRTA